MPVIIQCPYCPKQVKVAANVAKATCPECLKNFVPVPPDDGSNALWHGKPIADITLDAPTELPETEGVPVPEWMNVWGFAGFGLATLGLLLASVGGLRSVTVALSCLGLVVALAGIPFGAGGHKTKDWVWLALGSSLSGWVLLFALAFPGVLNNRWILDRPLPKADPNKQVAVPREQPRDPGRPLDAGNDADAVTEVIRQRDVIVGIESLKSGSLPDKGKAAFLLVHLRLGNIGTENLPVQGFSRDQNQPALTDNGGRSLAFVEQRLRQQAKGAAVFETSGGAQAKDLETLGRQDVLLVFEAPRAGFKTLKLELPAKLEVPASAWGRKGVCVFRISKLNFEASLPSIKK